LAIHYRQTPYRFSFSAFSNMTTHLPRCLTVLALLFGLPFLGHAQDAPTTPVAPVPTQPGVPADSDLEGLDEQLSGTVGPGWQLNYRAARKQANEEKKDLILLFTGSDWIEICKKLDREILNTEEFFQPIQEFFVPVRFDFPREKPLNDALTAQNQVLMASYRVQGFPTVMLTDSSGRPYAVNGYQSVSAKEYATILSAMRAVKDRRDDKFAAAQDATGLAKAQLLADGIPTLPGNLAAWFYRPELKALIANDLQNQTGKAVHFQRLLNDVDYSRTMAEFSRNVEWDKMIILTDDYIAGNQLKGEEKQHAMMNKASVLRNQGKVPAMVQTLLEIVAIDPETVTAKKAQAMLDQMRLENLQRSRPNPGTSPSGTGKEEPKP
jgi:thioredoxin-related protein